MKEHKCQESITCCYSLSDEPSEKCPVHGHPWPPRCEICGRFMKWPKSVEEDYFKSLVEQDYIKNKGLYV